MAWFVRHQFRQSCVYLDEDEAEYDTKNYADRGGCYPSKASASADNTLRVLLFIQNISRALRKATFTLLSFVANYKVDNIQ